MFPTHRPKPDIFAFQETHLEKSDETVIRTALGSQTLFSNGTNRSCGVLLGFNPRLKVEIIDMVLDKEGRYVVANLKVHDENITIVTVYLEPQLHLPETKKILTEITGIVAKFENTRVIYCGDYNILLDVNLDTNTSKPSSSGKVEFFNSFIDEQELTDIWWVQNPDTKRYKCFTNGRYLSQLDLFLVSRPMLTYVTDASIGLSYLSDHTPIYLDFQLDSTPSGKGLFRIPNFLLGECTYNTTIINTLTDFKKLNQNAEPDIRWDTAQAVIRGETIKFLATMKREKKNKIETLEAEVAQAVIERDTHSDHPDLVAHYSTKVKFLQIELQDAFQAEYAKKRKYNVARKYYQNGRSSRYYFRLPGRKYDSIKKIQNSEGVIISDSQEILDTTVKFYKSLYTQEQIPGQNDVLLNDIFLRHIPMDCISDAKFKALDAPITCNELYKALCTMKTDKSPGPSGLTVEFFRTFWSEISDLVTEAFQYAKEKGILAISERRGILRLVPKKNANLMTLKQWRPITLLNVSYKLLTKALSLRLKNVLPDLIHPDQKGFIQNRYIGDNVMDIYSIISQAEQDEEEYMLLLLDIQAAFDSVSWAFLHRVLEEYRFPASFIDWIKIIYKGKELCIVNNGHISTPIKPTKGLAQGDGLSPQLFVLVIETLALSIRENAALQGVRIGDFHKKIALLADDAILALKQNEISFNTLLQTLQHFATVSNLMVNREKSVLIPIGHNVENRVYTDSMKEFKIFDGEIFNYLGVDLVPSCRVGVSRTTNYANVTSYVDAKLQPRDNLNHNLLGRLLNLKAFIGSKMLYSFSMAPSPHSDFHPSLQCKLNNYVWSGGHHAMSCKLMYQPWDSGGMYMYSTVNQEHSLKLKWLNRLLLENDQFWQEQTKSCFTIPILMLLQANLAFKQVKYFCTDFLHMPVIWRDILRIWCKYNTCTMLRTPEMELLCGNRHINSTCINNGKLMLKYVDHGIYTVQDFLDHMDDIPKEFHYRLRVSNIYTGIPDEWKHSVQTVYYNPGPHMNFKVPLSVAQLNKNILQITMPKDIWMWTQWQTELDLPDLRLFWPSILQKRLHLTQITLRSFYVKYINRLYVLNPRLVQWGKSTTDKCSFCGLHRETVLHLYWECTKVLPLWQSTIDFCKTFVDPNANYCRNNCLLFGFDKPVVNLIMTLCKHTIHCGRVFKRPLDFKSLLTKIHSVKTHEFVAAHSILTLSVSKTMKYWGSLNMPEPFPALDV